MLSIGTNKLKKKIEAMQDTVFILEIQINTKAIQNCNEMKNIIETINFTKFSPENCVIKFRS